MSSFRDAVVSSPQFQQFRETFRDRLENDPELRSHAQQAVEVIREQREIHEGTGEPTGGLESSGQESDDQQSTFDNNFFTNPLRT